MKNKLKAQYMESVGELPAGYLHLPTTPIKQEQKLTDWIDGEMFNPFHIGVYETGYSKKLLSVGFQYWDGEIWGQVSASIDESLNRFHVKSSDQNPYFRGLSSNPNEVQS